MARISANDTTTTVVPTILVLCNDNDRPSKTKEQWSVCELKALTEFCSFTLWVRVGPLTSRMLLEMCQWNL